LLHRRSVGHFIRKLLLGAGVLFGIIVIAAVVIAMSFDVNKYKPQIETAVNKATGMELKINGKASLKILPTIHIALNDVHFRNPAQHEAGTAGELFSAKEISVSPQALPFIKNRQIIVNQVSLISPKIQVEKSKAGKFNFETAQTSTPPPGKTKAIAKQAAGTEAPAAPSQVHSIVIKDADLTYVDKTSGQTVHLTDATINLSDIALNGKQLTLRGDFKAKSLKAGEWSATDLSSKFRDDKGLINLDPTELTTYGGKITGKAQIDMRSATPKLQIEQNAPHVDLAQVYGKGKLEGFAEAKMNLTAQGKDQAALTKTSNGTVSIHSKDITLTGFDLDGMAGKLKTGQGLGMVNIGSSLMSGPLAPALGKAGSAAGTVAGKAEGGAAAASKTEIKTLVSDWKITNGVAQAQDAAISTGKHTIAFKGDVNLISKTYQNFYIATVDPKGCAEQKVEIEGPLGSPKPNAGSAATQVAQSYLGKGIGSGGSALGNEGKNIAGLFTGKSPLKPETPPATSKEPSKDQASAGKPAPAGCDPFYKGAAIQTG